MFGLCLCCWCDVAVCVCYSWLVCEVNLRGLFWCSCLLLASVALLVLRLCFGSFVLLVLGFGGYTVDFGFVVLFVVFDVYWLSCLIRFVGLCLPCLGLGVGLCSFSC